ncbi:OmpA family protein [Polaribacter sp. Q13]|uniref:OmpA family protein n=1 Tax=Polaribacter sp. Q13 TaxID=2806551 RepID=UPI00193B98F6|nr:OmpA family protein [Polaribacter sp. Q13]QVY64043.1 OmpA family protein [Polaribacter sp. Q13]
MKKLILGALFIGSIFQLSAQEFNKWSIDLGAGVQTIVFPGASGYGTHNPDFWQANIGARYMINEKFGLRLDFGYNNISEDDGSTPFKSNYYRGTLEGVINAGNLLNFKSWTNSFNVLVHGGAGISRLYANEPIDRNVDKMLHVMAGITPQYKLSNRVSLFLDVSGISNFYQSYTFDGAATTSRNGISGGLVNYSVGVNIALGNKEQHADWYYAEVPEVVSAEDFATLDKRLKGAEKEITELKAKGLNKNKLVTELDNRYAKAGTTGNIDFAKQLIDNGYVNVYFDVDRANVQTGSTSAINFLKQYLQNNSSAKAELIGYADETGPEGYNKFLSEKRAKTVYNILIDAGVSANKLSYKGVGEDTTATSSARQLARRVAIRVQK